MGMEPNEKLKLFRESQVIEGKFVHHVTNCDPCRTKSKYCKDGHSLWVDVEDIQERCRNAMREPSSDGSHEPDAYVCECGVAYSFSTFNCSCGMMYCGHRWRVGGQDRTTCDRCHGELKEKFKSLENAFAELFMAASNSKDDAVRAALKKVMESVGEDRR